jgi:hypothetical protein
MVLKDSKTLSYTSIEISVPGGCSVYIIEIKGDY